MNIKEKILDSIKYTTEKLGWTLVSEDWGDANSKCTCALGCVLLKNNDGDNAVIKEFLGASLKAAKSLGVSDVWADSFMEGFDGNGAAKDSKLPAAWTMGNEIRKETKPIAFTDFIKSLES